MKSIKYIIGVNLIMLLLASCGQRHDAISLADDFIDENAISPDMIRNRDYGDLDSTRRISLEKIEELNHAEDSLLKPGIEYAEYEHTGKLFFVRMKFAYGDTTMSRTFYFDEKISQVVAVK